MNFLEIKVMSPRESMLELANLLPRPLVAQFNKHYYQSANRTKLLGKDSDGLQYELTRWKYTACLVVSRRGKVLSLEEVLGFVRKHMLDESPRLIVHPLACDSRAQFVIDNNVREGLNWREGLK